MPIFSINQNKPKGYRDTFSRLVAILQHLQKNPSSKWRISCVLQTSTVSVSNVVDIAEQYNLVYAINKQYKLTPKGQRLLEVLSV